MYTFYVLISKNEDRFTHIIIVTNVVFNVVGNTIFKLYITSEILYFLLVFSIIIYVNIY